MPKDCESCRHYFKPGEVAVCTSVDVNRHVERSLDRPVAIRTAVSICDGKYHEPRTPAAGSAFIQITRERSMSATGGAHA